MALHQKMHSCFAGATARSIGKLLQRQPEWLQTDWEATGRFAAAEVSLNQLSEDLTALHISMLPDKVESVLQARREQVGKAFRPGCTEENAEKEEEAQGVTEQDPAELGDEETTIVLLAGNRNRLQSQLTTVEFFTQSTAFMVSLYRDRSEEAQALQAIHLSAATPTATYPFLVRPTQIPYIIEPDVLTDLLRMQGRLPLMDVDRARRRWAKCNALYDTRAYHAAFCPSTRAYIHDGIVRELRDCIRAAGACVLCEPVNVLPHAPEVDRGAQGEFYRPDLQITHLDNTGARYLVDVTTVDVTAATYRIDASKETGAAARKAESRKVREYRSKVDGRHTHLIPAAIELNGRWGEGMVLLFKKVVALATREGRK